MNVAFWTAGLDRRITVDRSKCLNNFEERYLRAVKRRIRPMTGFKVPSPATATLDGIETAHVIRKGQLGESCPSAIYASLAA
jgi:putative transposase